LEVVGSKPARRARKMRMAACTEWVGMKNTCCSPAEETVSDLGRVEVLAITGRRWMEIDED
jgi:hypothetical protein